MLTVKCPLLTLRVSPTGSSGTTLSVPTLGLGLEDWGTSYEKGFTFRLLTVFYRTERPLGETRLEEMKVNKYERRQHFPLFSVHYPFRRDTKGVLQWYVTLRSILTELLIRRLTLIKEENPSL